ncbi:MAG: pyrroline-5-carboxylate reductase [Marinifilaceae bacterium]
MDIKKIAIIGGGNIGKSIALGLSKAPSMAGTEICMTRRRTSLIEHLKEEGISISSDNKEATKDADIVFLAVKPWQIEDILKEIKDILVEGKTIVASVAATISTEDIEDVIGLNFPIFMVMPSTAMSISESMTCIAQNTKWQKEETTLLDIFNECGSCTVLPEELMPAATALASCGIAFAFRYIRAAIQGGVQIGFGADVAKQIVAQTVKGAASMIADKDLHPESEIDKVTTPKGITIEGLNEMEHNGFSSSIIKGLVSSYKKMNE